jgi:protein-disulfide isomerase
LKEYEGRIKLVSYHVAFSKKSALASQASYCAGAQGKYWEYHDKLFDKQQQWSIEGGPVAFFQKYAGDLHLDVEEFDSCLSSGEMEGLVKKDDLNRISRSVNSIPTVFIGDKRIVGAQSYFIYKHVITKLLEE